MLDFCQKLEYFLTHESAAQTKEPPEKMAGGFLSIIMPYILRFLDIEPV